MIGLIFAMKEEITMLKKISKNISTFNSQFYKYFIFTHNNQEFVATFSGIGKVNAAGCAVDLIKTFSVKKILNIGSCGSSDKNLNILDVVVLKNNYYLDVDATAFGYEIGQVPQEKPFFNSENNFQKNVKKILKDKNINFYELNGGTSDSFINKNNYQKIDKELLSKVSCIDMEATAINQIASKNKVDTCFIKVISDSLYYSKSSSEDFKENLKKISSLVYEITKNIVENIS